MAPRSMSPIAQLVPKSRSMRLVPVEFKTDHGLMQSTLRRTRGGSLTSEVHFLCQILALSLDRFQGVGSTGKSTSLSNHWGNERM